MGKSSAARATAPAVSATPPPGRVSAADVRRAIIVLLAAGEPMTKQQIQKAVGLQFQASDRASIGAQLRVLQDGDYVVRAEATSHKLTLSDSGRRWSRGIAVLSGRPSEDASAAAADAT